MKKSYSKLLIIMKNTIKTNTFKTLAICLSILSAQTLFAKSESRLETTSQVTGCRLQGTGAEMAELPLEDQIRQRTKTTTNCELRTVNCDNQGDNLDCHLMMDPQEIEEAEKTLKKGLGISNKKTSPARPSEFTETHTDSANSNTFTILQNRGQTPNTFSSSSQSIDPALKNQAQQAIKRVISNSSTQLQDHYKKADEAWTERDRGWKEQSQLHHELQVSRQQLTLSEQKLQQATKATTNEELDKTRLGKISKYAWMTGGILGNTPEPHAQVTGIGASALGGITGAINTAWAHGNLALIRREHQQISKQHELAQERKDQAQQQLLPLEQRAQQMEALAFTQAEQAARTLAEQLHPQADWQESQYQVWGTLVGPTWSENEKHHLINQARLNPSWVEEITRKSWEQKIETGKEQYTALQKKANLSSLERQYQNACQQHQRAQTQEGQQRNLLNQGQNSIEDLKGEIEKRVDELEKLETRDKIQFEQKKKEFIKKLEELEKTQLRLQGLQRKWEEAVERTSNQDEQRWTASKTYHNAKEEAERMLARIKKSYQTDRELLQKIWLKSASSNYKEWSLPEISSSHETENASNLFEETIKSEESAPPVQRLEEIEARGRNLRLREAMMNSATTAEKPTVLTSIFRSFSKQPSSSVNPSVEYARGSINNQSDSSNLNQRIDQPIAYSLQPTVSIRPIGRTIPLPSNLDQVREWAQQKQAHPSAQDQERWDILEQLDQVQKEISVKRKAFQQEESFMEESMGNGNEMDANNDDDDKKSKLSTATARTASSKISKTSLFSSSSSASSSLSTGKSSIFSFSGKTLFNSSSKKKSASSLSPINEESQDPQEKLRQLQEQASNLKKRYFELLDQAENERLSSLKGQRAAIPFAKETDRNYAWEQVDRKSVTLIQEKRQEEELEKLREEQQESWQTNTERWRARAQADYADRAFKQAQQRTLKLGEEATRARNAAQLTEANRKRNESLAEEEKLQQAWFAAEEEWEKMVQEYRAGHSEQSVALGESNEDVNIQASERLKERDRAINKRWEKFLKSYQTSELEKSAVEQEEISEAIMALEGQLEQAYQDSLITYANQKVLALAHYREVAFQRALDHARNHPEEMAEIWAKIASKQNAITNEKHVVAQLEKIEINKQAAAAFKEEAKRLEKIEKIWRRVLKEEQETAQQRREQAVQDYYRGNHAVWNSLSDQERMRYNSEAIKANKEYDQKRNEAQEMIAEAQAEKLRIESEIKRIGEKTWITPTKRKDKLTRYYQQLEEQGDIIKKTSEQLKEQEEFLRIGKNAKEKENYYEALAQAQWAQEKAREGKNLYWKKAAECYEQASTHWKEAADDITLESQQKKNKQVAASYNRAAESYQKAAEEHAALLTTQRRHEVLIRLYEEEGKLYEQLAEQQEKNGLTSDTSAIQESLYQLEKKIERYLGTRGSQIEELQENLPLLKKRLEELNNEGIALRQQGKEPLALKKEGLATSLQELLPSCQKALEDLFCETPESSERAAAAITAIQSHKTKDQQLQQTIEQTFQLEAKVVPLEQRAVLLSSEMTEAHGRGERLLIKGQHALTVQLNQVLEEARKVKTLLTQSEEAEDTSTQFQTCMKKLQQVEEQDRYLQQITPQLRQLDQNATFFTTRIGTLKNDIQVSKDQGDTFLAHGQEKLLHQANTILSEIDPIAKQLLSRAEKAEKASERVNQLLNRCTQFQQEDTTLQEHAASLRELGKKKNSFQKRSDVLTIEIIASQNRKEILLGEGLQQLQKTIAKALLAIEQTSKQILEGVNNSAEMANALLIKLKQLEERDASLQKNAPTLLALEQKKNHFQDRLKNLTGEIADSNSHRNNGKHSNYLSEGQQTLLSQITQCLSKIDESAQQLLVNASETPAAEAKTLLTQLDQLMQRDQQFQQNAPDLLKLSEKKNFFQHRAETLGREINASQDQQQSLSIQKQLLLEINQALEKIDQNAKQLLFGIAGQTQDLLSQLDLLNQRDQRLQQYLTQLKNLQQVLLPLQHRVKALENEIISSQIRGEISLAQAQKTLLEEINKTLQQTSQITKQLLAEDQGSSELAFQEMKKVIPLLDQLRLRDERLQENALSLRDLEQNKKLLQQRIDSLKTEITSVEKAGETLLTQQQQTFLSTLQQTLDKASEIGTQLVKGADQALEQAKSLFCEVDQLQVHDRQLKENILKVQELQQKKNILCDRLTALAEEMNIAQSQGEVLVAQGQQTLIEKLRGILSRIDEITEQLRRGSSTSVLLTTEPANTLLTEIGQFEQQDDGFQQNIPQLRECLEKGRFLHTHIAELKENITASQSSRDRGEQLLAQGQQKILYDYRQIQSGINAVVKQLLAGNKNASEQANALLTQIKQLLQREETLQKNIPILLTREKIGEITAKIEEAKQALYEKSGGDIGSHWHNIIVKLEQARDSWNKFGELVNQGKIEKACLWKKVAEKSEVSAEGLRQTMQAVIRTTQESRRLEREALSAYYTSDASTWLLKSEEALEKANQMRGKTRDCWKNLAEQYKIAANYAEKALEAHNADKSEKEGERSSWCSASRAVHFSAEYQVKAIEAEVFGKPEIARKYREAAEKYTRSAKSFTKAVGVYVVGKGEKGKCWHNVGLALSIEAHELGKAIESEVAGKPEIARKYREAAEKYNLAVEYYTKVVKAYNQNLEAAGYNLQLVGDSLNEAAEIQEKAIKADENNKPAIALKWREAVGTYSFSVEFFTRAVRAYEEENTREEGTCRWACTPEGKYWNHVGRALFNAANKQVKAIEADEASKPEIALKWREAAGKQILSVEPYTKAARTDFHGKNGALCLNKALRWDYVGYGFYNAAENLGKAIEADENGKPEIALKWREAAGKNDFSIEPLTKAAIAWGGEKPDVASMWCEAGLGLFNAADELKKAIEADEANKPAIAQKWREVVEKNNLSVDLFTKAAAAYEQGNTEEAKCWEKVGYSFHWAANRLQLVIEGDENNESLIAQKWCEVVKKNLLLVDLVDLFTKAARAYRQGKTEEGFRWYQAGLNEYEKL